MQFFGKRFPSPRFLFSLYYIIVCCRSNEYLPTNSCTKKKKLWGALWSNNCHICCFIVLTKCNKAMRLLLLLFAVQCECVDPKGASWFCKYVFVTLKLWKVSKCDSTILIQYVVFNNSFYSSLYCFFFLWWFTCSEQALLFVCVRIFGHGHTTFWNVFGVGKKCKHMRYEIKLLRKTGGSFGTFLSADAGKRVGGRSSKTNLVVIELDCHKMWTF